MSESKTKELLEQIIPLLKDESLWVRYSVIEPLGLILKADPSLTNKELLEQIKILLKDNDRDVRYSASKALGFIVQADPSLAKEALE